MKKMIFCLAIIASTTLNAHRLNLQLELEEGHFEQMLIKTITLDELIIQFQSLTPEEQHDFCTLITKTYDLFNQTMVRSMEMVVLALNTQSTPEKNYSDLEKIELSAQFMRAFLNIAQPFCCYLEDACKTCHTKGKQVEEMYTSFCRILLNNFIPTKTIDNPQQFVMYALAEGKNILDTLMYQTCAQCTSI